MDSASRKSVVTRRTFLGRTGAVIAGISAAGFFPTRSWGAARGDSLTADEQATYIALIEAIAATGCPKIDTARSSELLDRLKQDHQAATASVRATFSIYLGGIDTGCTLGHFSKLESTEALKFLRDRLAAARNGRPDVASYSQYAGAVSLAAGPFFPPTSTDELVLLLDYPGG